MPISNAYYRKDADGYDLPDGYGVKLAMENGEIWTVPFSETNRPWIEYQAWLADGYSTQSE